TQSVSCHQDRKHSSAALCAEGIPPKRDPPYEQIFIGMADWAYYLPRTAPTSHFRHTCAVHRIDLSYQLGATSAAPSIIGNALMDLLFAVREHGSISSAA